MSIIRKVITKFQMRNPIRYARRIGVTIGKELSFNRKSGMGKRTLANKDWRACSALCRGSFYHSRCWNVFVP